MERVEPSLQQQNNVNNSINQIYYQQNQNQEPRRKELSASEVTVDKQETKPDHLRNQPSPNNESNKNNNTNSGTSNANPQNRTKDSLVQGKSGQQSTLNGIAKMNGINAKSSNSGLGNNLPESVASTDDHHSTSSSNANFSKTNLYIKGLQQSTTDQDLYNMCSRFGQISSTKAILEPNDNGNCRGYGFVDFTTPQAAQLAVKELVKSGVQAQMAKLRLVHNNNSHNQHHNNMHRHQHNHNYYNNSVKNEADSTNLYIANLPIDTNQEELKALLSTYGTVVSTRLLCDEGNNPRGVGFARMESREKCELVIEQLGGRCYRGSKEPLLVKFADSAKPKRHSHNHQHQHQHQHHHNQHHQNYQKPHNDDSRWAESNVHDMNAVPMYDPRGNMSGSDRIPEAIMSQMNYSRVPHGFQPIPTAFSPLGPTSSATPWIHPSQPGQHYVIPQQILPPGSIGTNQPALHYAPITPLTAQMQGLQIAHAGHVGAYMSPQQWPPATWPQPPPPLSRPTHPQASGLRLPTQQPPIQQQPQPQQQPQQHQHHQQQQQQNPLPK